jgi:hypothetical protein
LEGLCHSLQRDFVLVQLKEFVLLQHGIGDAELAQNVQNVPSRCRPSPQGAARATKPTSATDNAVLAIYVA